MRQRIPLVLAMLALVIAILGATPIGHAGGIVRISLFARNAGKVNGIRAARVPRPSLLVPLNRFAKFPRSVIPAGIQGPAGAPGLAGPAGPAGPTGPAGPAGSLGALSLVSTKSQMDSSNDKQVLATCPSGKKAFGGGGVYSYGPSSSATLYVKYSYPHATGSTPTGWTVAAREAVPTSDSWQLTAYVICG